MLLNSKPVTFSTSRFQCDPVTPAVGAQISGLDLSKKQSLAVYEDLRQALARYGVLFLYDQNLSAEEFEFLAEQFGDIHRPNTELIPPLAGTRATAELKKKPGQLRNVGGRWHTDQMHSQQPSWACLLLARKTPPSGGDTLWANMGAAFETLSPGLQSTLGSLRGVHSDEAIQKSQQTGKPAAARAVHPAVITHPITGQKIMYVCSLFTRQFEGWSEEESKPLIDYLYMHAQKSEFSCRFRWREGALAIWDNYLTWHCAPNDYEGGDQRIMHRIVVQGPSLAA